MYNWRDWTPEERKEVLDWRMESGSVWHAPAHFRRDRWFHVTAACYEHRPLVGKSRERMSRFAREVCSVFSLPRARVAAWCLLPNHYHVLAEVYLLEEVRKCMGKLHGRSSHGWNVEDDSAGRKCFHRCLFKEVKSAAHWGSTLNYIHHNPVKHGYVERWQDWPFSSVHHYLSSVPQEAVREQWKRYPITGMGKNWDE
jgi:putative transposase